MNGGGKLGTGAAEPAASAEPALGTGHDTGHDTGSAVLAAAEADLGRAGHAPEPVAPGRAPPDDEPEGGLPPALWGTLVAVVTIAALVLTMR